MDSGQGAGFAFDMNMDFSNVFAKPNEGETSNSFFFGDEGIDTTTSLVDPIMFPDLVSDPPDNYIARSLQYQSLDNTSGSASVWNQLTPDLQNTCTMATHAFPPTPTHSFDSLYQPTYSNAMGKRPLQLDAQEDFPAPKRHESIGDFTLFAPMPQLTPAASIEFGLSDEAADMCAMWFNKYAILPSDRHIDSLSQLTGESADAIRHWFGRLMKQGMNTGHGDSAYRSQTALPQSDQFWNVLPEGIRDTEHSTGLLESSQEFSANGDISPTQETTTATQGVNALRGGKKSRCTPTDDPSLLNRDSSKIYQCTRKCGKRYGRKCDWKRNEEEGYPCKSWVCSLCTSTGVENVKPCFRKYHFAQHFRNIHPGVSCDDYEETSVLSSETEFPRRCGFCKHRFESRQERIDHIADHFKQGKCMLDWNDGDMSSPGSDNTDNDDNDDRPDDDSDSGPPRQPPPHVPRGGSNSKYYGGVGGGYSDGGNGGGSQGGYFQFQLSQLNESEAGSQAYYAKQHIKPTSDLRDTQQRTRCASEPPYQRIIEGNSSSRSHPSHGKLDATERDDADVVARNAVSKPLAFTEQADTSLQEKPQQDQQSACSSPAGTSPEPDWLDVLLKARQRVTIGKAVASSPAKGATSSSPTADSNAQAVDIARAKSAAPMFASGSKLDGTANAFRVSDGAKVADVPGATRSRTSAVPNPSSEHSPLVSKVSSVVSSAGWSYTLTFEQALQTVPTNSQSFLSVRFLGSGGFSTVDEVVHRGTKLRLGRKTLKNRDPAAVEELWKEVNVLQKLRHPHVIRFLGAYSQGDKMSILLSPIADTTLSLWLERFTQQKPPNFSQIITKMFGCLASSVRYLHEQRPVVKHLDIKPQNVLIVEGDGEFPHVVLCDFGISTSDDVSEGRPQPLTRQYVAPEVFGGFNRTSRTSAADIWSLGCVFAEMASMPYAETNSKWVSLRKEFSGRAGKYYWQDVAGLQNRLTVVLENATSATEKTVVRTLQAMLQRQPTERPDASSLTLVFTPAPCCLSWPNDKAAYPGPREELSSVEMLTHEDGVDCRTQVNSCSEVTTSACQGLPSAQNWLEQCSHTHEVCSHASQGEAKTLPTRLLDIRPHGDKSCVRVVDNASIASRPESVDYVALSHMWNESHTILTTDGLQAMKSEIPLDTLSCALKTAITAAQDLGFRYIWTDSLCVIQDNEDSKQEECANMASVFRNAALTLVLDSIDHGLEEFRKALEESESSFAWDTRAWALQERLLSHRFLHLGQEQMYWECNSLKASQTFPQGLPLLVWEKAHSKPDMLKAIQPGMKEMPSYNSLLAPDPIVACYDERLGPDAASVVNHKSAPPPQERLRDMQWIRKEGDGMGDSMESAQTALQVGGAQASSSSITNDKSTFVNAKLGNFPVFTTSTCGDGTKRLTVDGGTQHCDGNALLSSNDVNGRREIKASGQMDGHGSKNGRLRDGNPNANGDGNGMDDGGANALKKD
jgi:serine/threonine protein kinase